MILIATLLPCVVWCRFRLKNGKWSVKILQQMFHHNSVEYCVAVFVSSLHSTRQLVVDAFTG